MRIIAGSARGTTLAVPRKTPTRPTADRVREALFNILADSILDASMLDLFAGTGSVGLEALSRGARYCLFVERHPQCIECIGKNLGKARLADRGKVIRYDAWRVPAWEEVPGAPYDVVFIDPPYRAVRDGGPGSRLWKLLGGLSGAPHISAEGVVIVEHRSDAALPDEPPGLALADRRTYGDTALSFYEPSTPPAGAPPK